MKHKIKNKKTHLIIILLVLIVAVAALLIGMVDFTHHNDKVVATINGQKIYSSEVEEKLADVFQNSDQKVDINKFPKEVFETLVKDIYLQKELDKKASKSKAAKSKTVQQEIKNYNKKVIRKAYLDSLTAEVVVEQKVRAKYAELSNEFSGKKEMHIKHILVNNKDDAEKIYKMLKAKKAPAFEQLAKKYSVDTSNADLGGDLGYLVPDSLDEQFAKAIDGLKVGQISGPIQTKFGWHIVKIEDVRNVELPAFEAVKSTIEDQLKQEELEKIFDGITKGAKIKILIDLKPESDSKVPAPKIPAVDQAAHGAK